MATNTQILSLIRSHNRDDNERFMSIVRAMAADAEASGRKKVAADLTALVSENPMHVAPVLQKVPTELAGLMSASTPATKLSDLVLDEALVKRLKRILREHTEIEALEAHGLKPRRKLLLKGPPGTGKTMTASAIAGEMGLPLFKVRLDGVITKFMGETAAKLRLVFDAMKRTKGVYFFDEVDALAASRSGDNDVGEARRMLNSFLLMIEEEQSSSMVIAATNHPEILDKAIFRRFDAAFIYGMPKGDQIGRIIRNTIPLFSLEHIDWDRVQESADGLSQSEITTSSEDAAREAVLDLNGEISLSLLIDAMTDRKSARASLV